jgi:cation transport ATPase
LLPSAGISLDPSVAAGFMAGSSLAVVTNSIMLRGHFNKNSTSL